MKMNVDLESFKSDAEDFGYSLNYYFIDFEKQSFTNSKGSAINEINNCLKSYYKYIDNIQRVYSSTSNYLLSALNNIEQCEEDLIVTAKGNRQGK